MSIGLYGAIQIPCFFIQYTEVEIGFFVGAVPIYDLLVSLDRLWIPALVIMQHREIEMGVK